MNHVTADFIKQALEITNGLEVQTTKNCSCINQYDHPLPMLGHAPPIRQSCPLAPSTCISQQEKRDRAVHIFSPM